jgi:hypothetical protein
MSLLELLSGRALNLSINPTHHDRTLGQCMSELAPDGLSAAAREDLRALLRRMCAYDATQRPSAHESVSEIQRIVDSMDPAWRVSLEQYAHDVVERLFWRRRQVPLHEAIQGLEDAEIITGVFGGIVADTQPTARPLGRRPAAFLGFMFGTIIALSYYAWQKASFNESIAETSAAMDGSYVTFFVWLPSDARASIGRHAIVVPGTLRAEPGPGEVTISFEDGREVRCPLEVRPGVEARLVWERGQPALSVNDGPATICAAEPVAAEPSGRQPALASPDAARDGDPTPAPAAPDGSGAAGSAR